MGKVGKYFPSFQSDAFQSTVVFHLYAQPPNWIACGYFSCEWTHIVTSVSKLSRKWCFNSPVWLKPIDLHLMLNRYLYVYMVTSAHNMQARLEGRLRYVGAYPTPPGMQRLMCLHGGPQMGDWRFYVMPPIRLWLTLCFLALVFCRHKLLPSLNDILAQFQIIFSILLFPCKSHLPKVDSSFHK